MHGEQERDGLAYAVILTGKAADVDSAECRRQLAALFRTSPANIDQVFLRLPYVMKSGLDFAAATRYRKAVQAAGAAARLVPQTQKIDIPAAPPAATAARQDVPISKGDMPGKEDKRRGLAALWRKSPAKVLVAGAGVIVALGAAIGIAIYLAGGG